MNTRRSVTRGISGGIVLLGMALAFAFGHFNLAIFFAALAFASLVGSLSSPRAAYAGIHGFIWMLVLALFFATHSWICFLVGAALSAILGPLAKPMTAAFFGSRLFGTGSQQPKQPMYQPPQPYYEGYQPQEQYLQQTPPQQ